MLKNIDADQFKLMLAGGARFLEINKEMVDSLNVFPVPDGDTGTNMSMTMASAVKEIGLVETNAVDDVVKALARGALRGARGNSGVILSQILKGFSTTVAEANALTSKIFAEALKTATEVAYRAVTKPKEGTILTVIRFMAESAHALALKNSDIVEFLAALIKKGEEILNKTPDMLPVLKKAGVVDAGGRGLLCIFTGFYNILAGVEMPEAPVVTGRIQEVEVEEVFEEGEEIHYAYCTEYFIVHLKPQITEADIDKLREKLCKIGDCVIVIGDLYMVKVHVHSNHPNMVLQYALELGELDKIKIDNMVEQNRALTEKKQKQEPPKKVGMISICAGEGLESIFKELQTDIVIQGGQTMNPSVYDILSAIGKVNAESVLILPNNKNIILAAEQAKELADKKCFVLQTVNVPQGITAAINFKAALSAEENVEKMSKAFKDIQCGQVTYAVRTTKIDGFDLHEGDIIGLNDKKIIAKGNSVNDVVMGVLDQLVNDSSEVVTLYFGENVNEDDVAVLSEQITAHFPDVEVIPYFGGQPHYYYLIAVE